MAKRIHRDLSAREAFDIFSLWQRAKDKATKRGGVRVGYETNLKLARKFNVSKATVQNVVAYLATGKTRGGGEIPRAYLEAKKLLIKPKAKEVISQTKWTDTTGVSETLTQLIHEALIDGAKLVIRYKDGNELEIQQTAVTLTLDFVADLEK